MESIQWNPCSPDAPRAAVSSAGRPRLCTPTTHVCYNACYIPDLSVYVIQHMLESPSVSRSVSAVTTADIGLTGAFCEGFFLGCLVKTICSFILFTLSLTHCTVELMKCLSLWLIMTFIVCLIVGLRSHHFRSEVGWTFSIMGISQFSYFPDLCLPGRQREINPSKPLYDYLFVGKAVFESVFCGLWRSCRTILRMETCAMRMCSQ